MKSLTGSSELISLLLYIIVIASISHCCKQCTNGDTFTVIKSIIKQVSCTPLHRLTQPDFVALLVKKVCRKVNVPSRCKEGFPLFDLNNTQHTSFCTHKLKNINKKIKKHCFLTQSVTKCLCCAFLSRTLHCNNIVIYLTRSVKWKALGPESAMSDSNSTHWKVLENVNECIDFELLQLFLWIKPPPLPFILHQSSKVIDKQLNKIKIPVFTI